MKARHGVAGIALSLATAGSCTNDFDQFDVTAGGATTARGGSHTSASSGGSGANVTSTGGSAGVNTINTGASAGRGGTGTAGKGGTAGTTAGRGGAGGGRAGRGGAGNGASTNAGTAGESGETGTAGSAACEGPLSDSVEQCGACDRACATTGVAELACAAGVCTSSCSFGHANCSMPTQGTDDGCETDALGDPKHCGSCDNDCTALGLGFCGGGLCGCASPAECGKGAGVDCVADGCACDGTACRPGERCRQAGPDRLCACNGGAACGPTEACCDMPAGCVDIESSPDNCGACGHACGSGFVCSAGLCACDADADCDAGLSVLAAAGAGAGGEAGTTATGPHCVAGTCVCGSSVCGVGERCRADGGCGAFAP